MRSSMCPIFRVSMNRVSPCRPRRWPLRRSLDRNQRQAGIGVDRNNWPGSAMMQSTRPASMMFLRISPSPDLVGGHGAVGQHEPSGPPGSEMVQKVLHPSEVGVPDRRDAVLPSLVVPYPLPAPVGNVEGRVSQDVVGPQVGVAVVVETVAVGDLTLDAPDGQVHLSQPPCGVVGLLAVDGDVALGPAAVAVARGVGADELHRLDEHAR